MRKEFKKNRKIENEYDPHGRVDAQFAHICIWYKKKKIFIIQLNIFLNTRSAKDKNNSK